MDTPSTPDLLPDLIVMRHGETEWNVARRLQGALDSPLTARGRKQALALGAMFATMGLGPASHDLRTSPQPRAAMTAALAFGEGATTDPDLREIGLGAWTGAGIAGLRTDLAPDVDMLAFYDGAPEGEGFVALEHRARSVLARIRRPTILVTHDMTGRMIRTLALGRSVADLPDLASGQGAAFRIRDGVETMMTPDLDAFA